MAHYPDPTDLTEMVRLGAEPGTYQVRFFSPHGEGMSDKEHWVTVDQCLPKIRTQSGQLAPVYTGSLKGSSWLGVIEKAYTMYLSEVRGLPLGYANLQKGLPVDLISRHLTGKEPQHRLIQEFNRYNFPLWPGVLLARLEVRLRLYLQSHSSGPLGVASTKKQGLSRDDVVPRHAYVLRGFTDQGEIKLASLLDTGPYRKSLTMPMADFLANFNEVFFF